MSDKYRGNFKGKVDDIDKVVSKRLKKIRLTLGLRKKDIAQEIGVSTQQIQKYEKATNRISSGKLFAIAKYLKVPLIYFYEGSDDNYPCSSAFAEESAKDICMREDELTSLIKVFGEVKNPQDRKKIIKMATELVRVMA